MSKIAAWTFVALLLFVNVLRFVHLDADFPRGVTTSRALYTDEGLYSTNGLNLAAGRPWYTPGELNAIINLPVVPLLQAAVFRMFGPTLIVARSLVGVATLVLIAAAFALTRRYAPLPTAALVALILSVDFLLFSYSREALFDVIMTMVVTLAFAAAAWLPSSPAAMAVLAGTLAAVAVLTKTTALGALPAVAFLCGNATDDAIRKSRLVTISLATCVLVVAIYNLMAWYAYPADYVYFHRIAEIRLISSPLDWVRNIAAGIVNAIRFDPWLALASLSLAIPVFKTSAAFRANPLTRVSLIWALGIVVVFSITSYQPSRYFVVILVPLAVLFALALLHIGDLGLGPRMRMSVTVALLTCVLVPSAWRVGNYITHPRYSFVQMAREVGGIVNGPAGHAHYGTLLGNMAASISLESGVRPVSVEYGTRDLTTRLTDTCPSYLIALETKEDEPGILSSAYAIEPVNEWTVFDNYFEHRPVRLFRLHRLAGRPDTCSGDKHPGS